jgi:hypothetical protein
VNREVKIEPPLGEDVLMFETTRVEENLGGGLEYHVSPLSENHAVSGQGITEITNVLLKTN